MSLPFSSLWDGRPSSHGCRRPQDICSHMKSRPGQLAANWRLLANPQTGHVSATLAPEWRGSVADSLAARCSEQQVLLGKVTTLRGHVNPASIIVRGTIPYSRVPSFWSRSCEMWRKSILNADLLELHTKAEGGSR